MSLSPALREAENQEHPLKYGVVGLQSVPGCMLIAVHSWTTHRPRNYRKRVIFSSTKLCTVQSRFELHETCLPVRFCRGFRSPTKRPSSPLSVHRLSSFSNRLSHRRMVLIFFDYLTIQPILKNATRSLHAFAVPIQIIHVHDLRMKYN